MVNIKKNFMYHVIYQIMCMILPLATSPILAKNLGAEGVGVYAYVSSIVGYFVLAANLGIYQYGIRKIAAVRENKEELSRNFWEIWNLHKILAIGTGIIYVVFSLFFSEYALYFMILLTKYIGGVININWLFFGVEDFKTVVIRDMIIKIVTFAMIVLFIKSKNSLTIYMIIEGSGSLVSNLIYWFMYKKYVVKVKVALKKILYHWKGMLILFIPVLLESLYSNMDRVMIGMMCEKSEVGYYENADKALIARTITYSITLVLMPRMANILEKKDYDTFHSLMKQSTGIIILMASAFSFGTAAVAENFSVVFWGQDFIRCAELIMVMAMAMPAVVLSREIREQYLIPAEKDKEYLASAAAGTITNFIINAVMIPHYGATGAAIATVLSEYIVLIVQMIVVRQELPMLKYIHGNEIYIFFGICMFGVVRKISSQLETNLCSLLIQILIGGMIFSILCVGYWTIINEKYYFNLIKTCLRRKK